MILTIAMFAVTAFFSGLIVYSLYFDGNRASKRD
jgi:hypothetical protein